MSKSPDIPGGEVQVCELLAVAPLGGELSLRVVALCGAGGERSAEVSYFFPTAGLHPPAPSPHRLPHPSSTQAFLNTAGEKIK